MSRGIVFFLMIVVVFSWSCEDPNTLSVSKSFSRNNLLTTYIDTFSVVTSTVQMDTFLTNNTGVVMLGKYLDDQLGLVSASSYFQIGYNGTFLPDIRFVYDSAILVLPYNHYYTGDTTQPVKVNVYQLTETMKVRTLPATNDLKVSAFNLGNGFFNTTKFRQAASPIVSATFKFRPHRDSVYFRLPDSFGANWFRKAQHDSASLFSNPLNFVNRFFYGMHLDVDPSTQACVVGFNLKKVKLRIYYKQYVNDVLKPAHYDFIIYNAPFQFNHIEYDRSGTSLPIFQTYKSVSSALTNHVAYVQSGTGLVTRLDFPSLKDFFSISKGIVLNAAFLEVPLLRGTYPRNLLPPALLQLYTTDASNYPLSPVSSGTAGIQFDYEYGLSTMYRYQLFPFIFAQSKANTNYTTPLIIAPAQTAGPGTQGSSVQRVYIGDRFHDVNKIKLKIFYTSVPN